MTARWSYWLETLRIMGPKWAGWALLIGVVGVVLLTIWIFWTVLVRDLVLDARLLSGWPAWAFGGCIGVLVTAGIVHWLGDDE